MAATNINRVILTGNLTADPDLRNLPSGSAVCKLRLAVNTRRKDGASGEWVDKPNYFDITVWGKQGEIAAQYLSKGRPVAIDGRLEWREWQDQQGNKRQSVEVVADSVQFLGGGPQEGGNGGGNYGAERSDRFSAPASDTQIDNSDFGPAPQPAPVGGGGSAADDDIPF
ncbi:MAG: single-stranded DNA-binding protein [Solirubrobacteraceae bacterium]|nr:single-stranded DNA-binding protein [Solirubrobacteraceae bacterium]